LIIKPGVVILGKANLAQFAQDDENSETGGRCQNPFDLNRTCGTSMTGTGAGIAAGNLLNDSFEMNFDLFIYCIYFFFVVNLIYVRLRYRWISN
jgi:hypothetical protein